MQRLDAMKPAFSPPRLERLRDAMQRHVDRGYVEGVVTLVSRRSETHTEAIGAFHEDTIFRLASMTKPITAVLTMMLVEECKLRLDDSIEDVLPELANRRVLRALDAPLDDTVPAWRAITLRDLLTFRSGYGEVMFTAPEAPLQGAMAAAKLPLVGWPFRGTNDEFMKRLGALPLACQPGERWLYHMSAEILGVQCARVSKRSLGELLRDRIFEPLGMKDTAFHVPEEKLARLPRCFARDFATGNVIVRDEPRGMYARPPAFEGGGGGLVSTAADLCAFGRAMLSSRLLSRTTIDLMTADAISEPQKAASPFFADFWDRCSWGLGLGVVTHRREIGRSPGAFGWDGAFGTSFWIDPKEDLVGVLLVQRSPDALAFANPLNGDFWTSVYQSLE
jgi:CubicO group peptidase (beta-lactamase class C family)